MRELTPIEPVFALKPLKEEVGRFAGALGIEVPDALFEFLTTQNPNMTLERYIFLNESIGQECNYDEYDFQIDWAQFGCPVGSSFESLNKVLYEGGDQGLVAFGYDGAGNFFVISVRDMDFGVVYYYNWSYDIEKEVDKALIFLADDFDAFLYLLK